MHLNSVGISVELAENGQEAVEAFKRNRYDLIFMDIQMPILDGYEATLRIRELESQAKSDGTADNSPSVRRVPIIAMTAHALKGYKEKCLEAGMDDYITKPLRRKELISMVNKWISSDSAKVSDPASIENDNSLSTTEIKSNSEPIDLDRALEEFMDEKEVLKNVLEVFIQNASQQVDIINKAIRDQNSEIVRKEAHAIKGGASNLAAERLANIAFTLENIGSSDTLDQGYPVLQKLEAEIARLDSYVEDKF